MYLKRVVITERVKNLQCDIQEIINNHNEIKNYAYILHGKDVKPHYYMYLDDDMAAHYHIYLDFGNFLLDEKEVADWFGLNTDSLYPLPDIISVKSVIRWFIHRECFDSKYRLGDIKTNLKCSTLMAAFAFV